MEQNPGEYLARMNRLLLPILRQDDTFLYATACYMIFDAASGLLQFASAGHPVPLHFQGQDRIVKWLMGDPLLRGPALAILEEGDYQTFEKVLQPGESVVMYTDGLYEAESPEGEEFGEDRLLVAASHGSDEPLERIFSTLMDSAVGFSGENGFNDDVCLVGFTFCSPM